MSVHLLYLTISNLAGKTVALSNRLNGFFCGEKNGCKMSEMNENVNIFELLLFVVLYDDG